MKTMLCLLLCLLLLPTGGLSVDFSLTPHAPPDYPFGMSDQAFIQKTIELTGQPPEPSDEGKQGAYFYKFAPGASAKFFGVEGTILAFFEERRLYECGVNFTDGLAGAPDAEAAADQAAEAFVHLAQVVLPLYGDPAADYDIRQHVWQAEDDMTCSPLTLIPPEDLDTAEIGGILLDTPGAEYALVIDTLLLVLYKPITFAEVPRYSLSLFFFYSPESAIGNIL